MDLHRRDFLLTLAAAVASRRAIAAPPEWRAGFASADITPPPGVWMAGYAARKEASQGTALPLHAKALVLEDAAGRRPQPVKRQREEK